MWDFIDGGAGDEQAIAANRHSLNDVVFQPKYLVDVSKPDTSLTIFGTPVSHPLVLSPSGLATLAHPDGEIAVARAAQGAGAIFVSVPGLGIPLKKWVSSRKADCGSSSICEKAKTSSVH